MKKYYFIFGVLGLLVGYFSKSDFSTRGYYGTINHNAKAVFQYYFGWWDGVPANYNRHVPVEEAKRYVAAMGGVKKALALGIVAFDQGDYRWSSTVFNHMVFADSSNLKAKQWLAASYEQQGFQSEAGSWRNYFLQAAREGCDPDTMEGRAQIASKAKPLWLPLPDGTLKRQLLREIASLVAIGEHELTDLWIPKAQGTSNRTNDTDGGNYKKDSYSRNKDNGNSGIKWVNVDGKWKKQAQGSSNQYEASPRSPLAGRTAPVSRADHALQMLLLDNPAWQHLSNAEHHLLCELPAPHGEVFTWLDGQIMEHGAQTWGALSESLRGHAHESFAHKLITTLPDSIEPDPQELAQIVEELRRRALEDELKDLSSRAASDPAAYARYKELLAQKLDKKSK